MKTRFTFLLFIFYLNSNAQDFKKHILFLASDSLHGRAPGTIDELHAANYIAAQFHAAKCHVVLQRFPFRDDSQMAPAGYVTRDSAINVIGILNLHKGSTIIISAHYDHLGFGSNKSREIGKKGIYHGADDNASGVAMLIELAKWISLGHSWKYNFVFAAWSGHETGLLGSGYFAQSKLCSPLKIRMVINMDMVGRLDTTSKVVRVSGAETDSTLYRVIISNEGKPIHFYYNDENINDSDLKPFAEKKIAVLNLTTGIHDDYHRTGDTENKINYKGMVQIEALLHTILSAIAGPFK